MGIAADLSLIVVFGLALGALAHRLGQPTLLGYVVAGVLLGPHTGGLSIHDPHEIELLAEIGIALLLFSIGIEFSLDALRSVRGVAIGGTLLQIALTYAFGWTLGGWVGLDPVGRLWLGAMVSVSSTMVVLKTLAGGRVLGTLSSRVMLGMLIAQDLAVIPMMIVLPQLSAPPIDWGGLGLALGRSTLILVVLVFAGRVLVPRLMHFVVVGGSRELFILSVVTLGLGVGYLSHQLGLSYALGAFVAGLVLSESPYGHQALSDVIPLRDLFGLVFFASVGMLLDPRFVVENLATIALLVAMVVVGKAIVFAGVTRVFGYRNIVPIAAALTMSQIGEFSFLLAQLGRSTEAIGPDLHALVVATTVTTMLITPYLARLSGPAYRLRRRWTPQATEIPSAQVEVTVAEPTVVAGAGRVGQRVAWILRSRGIDVVLVDFDHQRCTAARAQGWPVVFGDAAQEPVLRAAGIERARMAIVTVPAAVDAVTVAARIRSLAPEVPLIVRTDSIEETADLIELGVLNIVEPEFEAALEMAREALLALGCDRESTRAILDAEREGRFGGTDRSGPDAVPN